MAKFITAEELKNRTSKNSEEKSKREFELQHNVIEYRLKTSENPCILVPNDLRSDIKAELEGDGYHVTNTKMHDESNEGYLGVIYIGAYKLADAKIATFPYTYISWEFWANIFRFFENKFNLRENSKRYEIQHRIIEYRLEKEKHIIVPWDLLPQIETELKVFGGYHVELVDFYSKKTGLTKAFEIHRDRRCIGRGIVESYKKEDEDISWAYWANVIGPHKK